MDTRIDAVVAVVKDAQAPVGRGVVVQVAGGGAHKDAAGALEVADVWCGVCCCVSAEEVLGEDAFEESGHDWLVG